MEIKLYDAKVIQHILIILQQNNNHYDQKRWTEQITSRRIDGVVAAAAAAVFVGAVRGATTYTQLLIHCVCFSLTSTRIATVVALVFLIVPRIRPCIRISDRCRASGWPHRPDYTFGTFVKFCSRHWHK